MNREAKLKLSAMASLAQQCLSCPARPAYIAEIERQKEIITKKKLVVEMNNRIPDTQYRNEISFLNGVLFALDNLQNLPERILSLLRQEETKEAQRAMETSISKQRKKERENA